MTSKDKFTELAIAFAWEPIVSKNPLMISFIRANERLNFYFTTGTVTIQSFDGMPRTLKGAELDTIEQFIA